MAERNHAPVSLRFGPFDVSPDAQELRKHGVRLKLSGQAIQVLLILLKVPGQVVTREELQQELWPGASFGDFEHGLNAAVNRLREVLGDSATEPKFIETVPRRGYRFIGQIEPETPAKTVPVAAEDESSRWENRAVAWFRRHWVLGISGAGALLVICVGTYVLEWRVTKTPENLTVVPFTSYPGFEAAPSFSPDGNQIVFNWYHGNESSTMIAADLYVKQIGNEHAVRLTNHDADFIVPAWSPDGQNIAFGMVGKDGNGIYLMPALGGWERRLATIGYNIWPWLLLSWSPDSRWVAFASDSPTKKQGVIAGHLSIHLVNVETAEERVVPEPAADCTMAMEPAFSPDGKYLASVCVHTWGVSKVYVQLTDGGQPRELAVVNSQYDLAGLAWTADGRSILYGANGSLWRVPATGGTRQKLSFAHGVQTPAIARGRNKLAYAQTNFHWDIQRIGLTTKTTAADPSTFISSSWDQENPQISPDGRLIAFDSNRSGNSEIWICDRDGANLIQLTSFGGPLTGTPRWSPNGSQIVFDSRVSGHSELYVVSVDGGLPRRLATGTPNAVSPFWSADGQRIYFGTERPDAVWKVPAEGGVAVRLTKEGTYYPQESADGKRVYYVEGGDRNEIWSVSVNGGDEHREEGMPTFVSGLAWTPAQNGIYFVDGSPSHYSIAFFDFAARHVDKVLDLHRMSFVWGGIAISRDNDTLLFSGLDHLESDIMLVEGFQ